MKQATRYGRTENPNDECSDVTERPEDEFRDGNQEGNISFLGKFA